MLPIFSDWSDWSDYGSCDKPCGGGRKSRQRRCEPDGYGCGDGPTQDYADCNTNICPCKSLTLKHIIQAM